MVHVVVGTPWDFCVKQPMLQLCWYPRYGPKLGGLELNPGAVGDPDDTMVLMSPTGDAFTFASSLKLVLAR